MRATCIFWTMFRGVTVPSKIAKHISTAFLHLQYIHIYLAHILHALLELALCGGTYIYYIVYGHTIKDTHMHFSKSTVCQNI